MMLKIPASISTLLKAIHTYQVDASPGVQITLGARLVTLNEEEFLSRLYVARGMDLEERLAAEISLRQSVVCVFGNPGCGKTSLLRSVARRLRNNGLKVLILDIKVIWEQIVAAAKEPLDLGNLALLEFHLTRVLRDALLSRLWPTPPDRDRLFCWLLAGPAHIEDSDRLSTLTEAVSLARCLCQGAGSEDHSARFESLLNTLRNAPHTFQTTTEKLLELLAPSQLALAYARLCPDEPLVIVYDNVDRIPDSAPQKTFLRIVNDFQLAAAPMAASVVGIRRENLHAAGARPNRAGDVWIIHFLDSRWPGFTIGGTEEVQLQNVLGRRHDFFNEALADAQDEGATEVRESTGRLHGRILPELARESLLLLVNGNFRAANSLYADFLPFLLDLWARYPEHFANLVDTDAPENHVQTLLYYWIRERGRENDIPLFDFERDAATDASQGSLQHASLEHLVMTSLLNLRRAGNGRDNDDWHGWPSEGELLQRLVKLGFQQSETLEALKVLRGHPGEPNQVVEFDDGERGYTRVRLGPVGSHLLLNVYNKVGFIWAPALSAAPRELRGRTYFEMSTTERVLVIGHYLTLRAYRHLEFLTMLRPRLRESVGIDWLRWYRQSFGVNGTLQIERLVDSATDFYHWHSKETGDNLFADLSRNYSNAIKFLAGHQGELTPKSMRRMCEGLRQQRGRIIGRLKPRSQSGRSATPNPEVAR